MTALMMAGGWPLLLGLAVFAWRSHARSMELVARCCHELRGPLAAARLGLALGQRGDGLPARTVKALDLELERAALALDDLERVRRATRIRRPRRASRRQPEDVDLRDLLSASVEAWQAVAASRGAKLALRWSGTPVIVWGDRVRLAQAAGNLIANGLEHGAGAVEVRGAGEGRTARLEVIDDGAGLPAPVAVLARRPRAGRGARGRGLAIAMAIAEEHGGRLAAGPSERGARLVLELPIRVSGAGGPSDGAPRPDQAAARAAGLSVAGGSTLDGA